MKGGEGGSKVGRVVSGGVVESGMWGSEVKGKGL